MIIIKESKIKFTNISCSNNIKKLALIGPYPPPYGGVSIHIERIEPILKEEKISYLVYNLGHKGVGYNKSFIDNIINIKYPIFWIMKFLFKSKENVIHNHYFDMKLAFLLSLLRFKGKKIILTIHSEYFIDKNWYRRRISKYILNHYSLIIAVNEDIKSKCISIGVPENRIKVIPAYIKPKINKREIDEIPQDIWDFIKNHHPIISSNAAYIDFINNEEVYGIDLCINLCEKLQKSYKNMGFIFQISKINNQKYFSKMMKKIYDKKLENNFKLINLTCQFYPILMKSDIFIRATITDGDAISVRESLDLKIPTIVSDVVKRPKGTILFKNKDLNDLCIKVNRVLKNIDLFKKKLKGNEKGINYSKDIINIYKKLLDYSEIV